MKMMGTRPLFRYPSRSSRLRMTTSPAMRAQGNAGRSKFSTASFSASSALDCNQGHGFFQVDMGLTHACVLHTIRASLQALPAALAIRIRTDRCRMQMHACTPAACPTGVQGAGLHRVLRCQEGMELPHLKPLLPRLLRVLHPSLHVNLRFHSSCCPGHLPCLPRQRGMPAGLPACGTRECHAVYATSASICNVARLNR